MDISVCIITFNEETHIRQCLESVKWAKEIIVVDSFSTDKTVDICKEYDVKVVQTAWEGFGKTKNIALKCASCSWILSLDADERVDDLLKEEIFTTLASDKVCDGYFIPRKSFFGRSHIKYCGWYPDYTLRLLKKGAGKFKELHVHEAIELEKKDRVAYLRNPLMHYTYQDITDFVKRLNRYSSLSVKDKKDISMLGIFSGIMCRPFYTFFKMYILKKGFLGGMNCFVLSVLYSFQVFVKYAKMYELRKENLANGSV